MKHGCICFQKINVVYSHCVAWPHSFHHTFFQIHNRASFKRQQSSCDAMSWPTMQCSSQRQRKSQQLDKCYLYSHTHTQCSWKASLGKVTSTVKHAELHCRASLPVRHWCGNSHLRVIMGWLAPRVWDPGADSLSSRKRERGEEICTLDRRMSHSLHPSNSLCSVSFSVSISFSSPDLSPPLS